MQRKLMVAKMLVTHNPKFLSLGSSTEEPSTTTVSKPIEMVYREGSVVILWETNIPIPLTGERFWVDCCGCIFTPSEIDGHMRAGTFKKTASIRNLPRPS